MKTVGEGQDKGSLNKFQGKNLAVIRPWNRLANATQTVKMRKLRN
jgi:hypothetical protein